VPISEIPIEESDDGTNERETGCSHASSLVQSGTHIQHDEFHSLCTRPAF